MKLTRNCLGSIAKMLDFYSQFNPSPLSIKQFFDFGISACERKSFIFLRKELPVRLANIMKEIHLLPDNLLKMPSVGIVNNLYATSFEEIIHFEKVEINDDNLYKFCQALIKIRNRHTDVVQTMAQGVLELKDSHDVDIQTENSIQYFLDRFFMSRISIRMLINQHTLLFGGLNGHNRHVGCIDPSCDVIGVIKDAYENARFLCDQYYMASPELIIKQHNELVCSTEIRIIYVPSHLYHMLFEIFKNSMRAVMEHHGEDSDNYPPVEVVLVRGKEDICVKALSTEANELLPIFNKSSSKFYRTPVPTADWSSQCGGGMATRQLSMGHMQNHRLPHGIQGNSEKSSDFVIARNDV
ncbi:PREDICTED: pyruvate dehydrogenase (acetyl-transferring) kinase, mitochondrial isoform X3 [Dinoponera quadriceps]|uniref:Protein-serine/threonine kinase n=1 Tax=Dinoponera quadriceps TaxID=609295 RepID=A0A6P3Y955_DINQU|nr:PREDICTED: pyruvate dehydrogenase (acetyl-transferring) kinase, mitochondrial isoform X3 [Dinoponera quadriceps]